MARTVAGGRIVVGSGMVRIGAGGARTVNGILMESIFLLAAVLAQLDLAGVDVIAEPDDRCAKDDGYEEQGCRFLEDVVAHI
jgi:hypothetical protein